MRSLYWILAPLTLAPLAAGVLVLLPTDAEASRVVYVNTDPVTVQAGAVNDPSTDTVNVNGYMMTEFDGWVGATDEQKAELLALLKDTSVAFDIVFVGERPATGPYDMVVFGSADDHMSSFGGTCSTQVGLSDCGDASGPAISFAYWGCLDLDDQLDPERVAFHTLGALGYGWGLENIAGNGQVMSGWSNSALKFGDACANLDGGGSGCVHAECSMGEQNSSADLLANIGARVDDGAPEIVVIEPQPGADVVAPFDVVVEIEDAFGGITAQLEVVGLDAPPAVDEAFPYRWNSLGLGDGPVTLLVTATDADGNERSTEIPVCVGGGCPDTGDGG
uniref:hypothetical protein n=1 Tax=Enhygromyxa salina TaxID=215803 RepID=UPI001C63827C